MIVDGRFRRPDTAFTVIRRRPTRGRQHDDKHLAFIRTLPCVVSGVQVNVEAAHIRYSDAAWGKVNPGIGRRPDDRWTVPLCARIHRDDPRLSQHSMNERSFWDSHFIDPLKLASALYEISGDYEAALQIILEARG